VIHVDLGHVPSLSDPGSQSPPNQVADNAAISWALLPFPREPAELLSLCCLLLAIASRSHCVKNY
jgi:hypothetical protein